jgi:hypothetical protein
MNNSIKDEKDFYRRFLCRKFISSTYFGIGMIIATKKTTFLLKITCQFPY